MILGIKGIIMPKVLTNFCVNCSKPIAKTKNTCSLDCKTELKQKKQAYDFVESCKRESVRGLLKFPALDNVDTVEDFIKQLAKRLYSAIHSQKEKLPFYVSKKNCLIFLHYLAELYQSKLPTNFRLDHSDVLFLKDLPLQKFGLVASMWVDQLIHYENTTHYEKLCLFFFIEFVIDHLFGSYGFDLELNSLSFDFELNGVLPKEGRYSIDVDKKQSKKEFTETFRAGNVRGILFSCQIPHGCDLKHPPSEANLTAGDVFYLFVNKCPTSENWGGYPESKFYTTVNKYEVSKTSINGQFLSKSQFEENEIKGEGKLTPEIGTITLDWITGYYSLDTREIIPVPEWNSFSSMKKIFNQFNFIQKS